MVYAYTTSALVASEIRATTDFGAGTTPTQTTVNNWINQVSERINMVSGRTWGTTQYTEYFDYSGKELLTLSMAPVVTVDTVQYNQNPLGSTSGTDWVTKTAETDYSLYTNEGQIAILPSWNPAEGRKRIKVIYTAGYTAIPERVEELATKEVALKVLQSLVTQNVNEGNDGGSISVGQISIVEPASYGVNSYKQLRQDVQQLWSDVKGTGVYRYKDG